MGNAHAIGRRPAPAALAAVLLAVAILLALGTLARPAVAQETFTQCGTCHDYALGDAYHNQAMHKAQTCGTCHVNGSGAAGLVPSACVSCHGTAAQIIADPATSHGTVGCGTTDGCHGYTSPTPTPSPTPSVTRATTTMMLKASPSIQRVRRTVRFTGSAGPIAALAGAKVTLKVQRKVGTRWVTMKTASRVVGSTGKFSWSYKTAKRGTHHITASIKGTAAYTAKKLVRTFKVK
jgi:hypothetical protein